MTLIVASNSADTVYSLPLNCCSRTKNYALLFFCSTPSIDAYQHGRCLCLYALQLANQGGSACFRRGKIQSQVEPGEAATPTQSSFFNGHGYSWLFLAMELLNKSLLAVLPTFSQSTTWLSRCASCFRGFRKRRASLFSSPSLPLPIPT